MPRTFIIYIHITLPLHRVGVSSVIYTRYTDGLLHVITFIIYIYIYTCVYPCGVVVSSVDILTLSRQKNNIVIIICPYTSVIRSVCTRMNKQIIIRTSSGPLDLSWKTLGNWKLLSMFRLLILSLVNRCVLRIRVCCKRVKSEKSRTLRTCVYIMYTTYPLLTRIKSDFVRDNLT